MNIKCIKSKLRDDEYHITCPPKFKIDLLFFSHEVEIILKINDKIEKNEKIEYSLFLDLFKFFCTFNSNAKSISEFFLISAESIKNFTVNEYVQLIINIRDEIRDKNLLDEDAQLYMVG